MSTATWASNPWVWVISFKPLESRSAPNPDVKERPILFRGEMVRAILEGRKTQTRRVCTLNIVPTGDIGDEEYDGPKQYFLDSRNQVRMPLRYGSAPVASPYGKPGERLWVRETWGGDNVCGVAYRADHPDWPHFQGDGEQPDGPWRPSIHMPRWACRLVLEVTDVRVERLQDISEEDAKAEGVKPCGGFMTTAGCWTNYGSDGPSFSAARDSFRSLWESIHG